MIRDRRVLENEFVPEEVVHREHAMETLTRALRPLTWGDPAETTMLFGPSGTGKTCLARFATERLRAAEPQIASQYVDCWADYTRFQALYRILEGTPATASIKSTLSIEELLARLELYDGPPLVAILDEVGQLQDKRVIGDLYRARDVFMILIANQRRDLFGELRETLASRIRATEQAHLDRYGIEELVAILETRAERGIDAGGISRAQLREIADAVAGNARVGMTVLRKAARRADEVGAGTITDAMIEAAVPDAETDIHTKDVGRLQPHQRTLYEIVCEHGPLAPGALYREYCERESSPRSKRTMREYLGKMAQYNLLASRGDGPAREYYVTE